MKEILNKYLNEEIGLNLNVARRLDCAMLLGVRDCYFSVKNYDSEHIHHIPYTSVVDIIEDSSGIKTGGLFSTIHSFECAVRVGHIIENMSD